MKIVNLYRVQTFKSCTRGILTVDGLAFFTLELPWKDNRPNISRIPIGKYICKWHKSPKYGWVYQVMDVYNRSFILIHSGNIARHTKGCILIGSRFGKLGKSPAVLSSKTAVRKFQELMNKQDFILEVS